MKKVIAKLILVVLGSALFSAICGIPDLSLRLWAYSTIALSLVATALYWSINVLLHEETK